ncbi:MAG: zinc-ribbon domain-containing protein, partial [Faecalibacterium sp.]
MRYTCKNCGCELPDDAQFCTHCGTKVSAPRCPSCGRILPEDAAFCTFCGTRLVPEETRAENTTEQSVESLPEDPTVELEPTSSEKEPESVSSPAEAASASLPTQQACPSESVPLPPNAPPDAAQPSAEEQAVPSASEPIEEEHPDTASDHAGNASPVPAPDVPALPADAEPPAFLLDGKSDIFQRLKQYEQNGDTRSEEYSRLRKQEKSA